MIRLRSYIAMSLAAGVMTAAVSSLSMAGPALNSATPMPSSLAEKDSKQLPTAGQTALIETKMSRNSSATMVFAPGFVAVDGAKTLTCPAGRGRCRIEAHQNVQVTGGPGGANRWAICTQVDGVFMNQPLCPFQGVIDPAIFQAGSFVQSQNALLPGTHTVQTFLYSDSGATRGIFAIVYHLYN